MGFNEGVVIGSVLGTIGTLFLQFGALLAFGIVRFRKERRLDETTKETS